MVIAKSKGAGSHPAPTHSRRIIVTANDYPTPTANWVGFERTEPSEENLYYFRDEVIEYIAGKYYWKGIWLKREYWAFRNEGYDLPNSELLDLWIGAKAIRIR